MMGKSLRRYAERLTAAGLVEPGGALLAGLDDVAAWNAPEHPLRPIAENVLATLGSSALLLAKPAGAQQKIIAALARRALDAVEPGSPAAIAPGDCETRTFLHDIPALEGLDAGSIAAGLARRTGCVLLDDRGEAYVAASGAVSPEQTFVAMSSICFACFTAYFAAYLADLRWGRPPAASRRAEFAQIRALLPPERLDMPNLAAGPFRTEEQTRAAIIAAGRSTVEHGLVDSYFGNISYRLRDGKNDVIHISQTGSSLDELAACIDPCRMDGKSCAALTASSEFAAHRAIYAGGTGRAILHGHPRFSVVLSMDCDRRDCPGRGECHRTCAVPRAVTLAGRDIGIPIIPGEVGNGPHGLCNTLPPALLRNGGHRGALVYGHGVFCLGETDFREAFATLLETEHACRTEYFRRVAALGG